MKDFKVLKFRNKKAELKEIMKKQQIKEVAHFLINECKGDFAIVFKTKDIEHLFDGIQMNKNFIVAMSDIEKIIVDHPEYFFQGFNSRQYFDLDSD